ncbi:MAG: glycosyltransferase [Clostridia bacterium]|nr:glycosyltransferase [Clostridia bacterium]
MNELRPRISVIVPCYQSAETIARTVASIQAQTFADWELIAVDDGSSDHTMDVLTALAEREPRMRVFHQENGGVSSARNAGIAKAVGEWLFFVDADDHLLSHALEHLLNMTDEAADVVCGAYWVHRPNNEVEDCRYTCTHGGRKTMLESLIRGDSALNSPCARLYRTSLIRENGIVFPDGVRIGEDVLFNLEAFMAARAWRISDEVIYIYELGGGSAMISASSGRFEKTKPMLRGIAYFLEKNDLCTDAFRAHLDVYIRTLRAEHGRMKAAFVLNRDMISAITKGVQFCRLSGKEKLYYVALKLFPALSVLLP